jgi:hypothetical protein
LRLRVARAGDSAFDVSVLLGIVIVPGMLVDDAGGGRGDYMVAATWGQRDVDR